MRLTRLAPAAFALLLVGCGDPAKEAALQAEREYDMVTNSKGTMAEQCEAAERVADAWRTALDQTKYEQWTLTRNINCRRAEQIQRHGF